MLKAIILDDHDRKVALNVSDDTIENLVDDLNVRADELYAKYDYAVNTVGIYENGVHIGYATNWNGEYEFVRED